MSKQDLARTLYKNGDVNQVDPDTFVCHGSNGNQYQIIRVKDPQYNYEFYCKCPAWKFDESRRCKHVLAVELFEQNSPSSQYNQPSHTHTATKPKVKPTLRSTKPKVKPTLRSKKTKGSKGYKVKKDGNKNTMDWTEPDGSTTKFQFDSEGNLIGKVTK